MCIKLQLLEILIQFESLPLYYQVARNVCAVLPQSKATGRVSTVIHVSQALHCQPVPAVLQVTLITNVNIYSADTICINSNSLRIIPYPGIFFSSSILIDVWDIGYVYRPNTY